MLLDKLKEKKLINPPDWLISNTHYLTLMGSNVYGCNSGNSDWDIYGFCIPKKSVVFPHIDGYIEGFSTNIPRFEEFQQHHIFDEKAEREYDITVFSIVKYFRLLMDNNPNIIDSLFVRSEDILHITHIGTMIRDSRQLFLHKGCFHRFKGYAFSMFKKIRDKNNFHNANEVRNFEETNGISHDVTLKDIEEELKSRGL